MDRLKRAVFPAMLAVAGYYMVFGGEYSWWDVRQARAQHVAEGVALEALNEELDSLRARVDLLENDPETLERLARERYGMVRDGEVLYRVVQPEVDEDESGRSR